MRGWTTTHVAEIRLFSRVLKGERRGENEGSGTVRILDRASRLFSMAWMAERVGFEPTCRLPDKTLSRRPRYDHFPTDPQPSTIWAGSEPPETARSTRNLSISTKQGQRNRDAPPL